MRRASHLWKGLSRRDRSKAFITVFVVCALEGRFLTKTARKTHSRGGVIYNSECVLHDLFPAGFGSDPFRAHLILSVGFDSDPFRAHLILSVACTTETNTLLAAVAVVVYYF